MTDTTWRDAYDDPEGLAEELDKLEKTMVQRGLYSEATDVHWAAHVLREQAERIEELEAQPTPAPEGEARPNESWSLAFGSRGPVIMYDGAPADVAHILSTLQGAPTPAPEEGALRERLEATRRQAERAWGLAQTATERNEHAAVINAIAALTPAEGDGV